jgi:nucleotide-binding universal stress UspA family protein
MKLSVAGVVMTHNKGAWIMSYGLIITIVSGEADDERVLLAAAEMARQEGARLKVIVAMPMTDALVWSDAFGTNFLAEATIVQINEANARRRRDLADTVQRVAEHAGLPDEIEYIDERDPPWLTLEREAPLADLVVLGAKLAHAEGFWGGMPGEALMNLRKPILIVRAAETIEGGAAAIAWDGSLPAGRAVQGAIPLLRRARSVVILQYAEGLTAEQRIAGDAGRLVDYLSRRGVKNVSVEAVEGRREGAALLKTAIEAGAGLLVAGAYGHSRLGEALVGGATRAFTESSDGPHLLLAH